jgi:molybdate transport system ATP-binding protein
VLRHRDAPFELDVRFTSAAQRVVLYGPSGAGKTQTLRMIAGITAPDAGRVVVADRVLYDSATRSSLSPQQRRLGYVFQDYALFPHLTVRQNIAFARRSGWRNPHAASRTRRSSAGSRPFISRPVAGHYPHQISGGQRQRTALARALVTEPSALLLDEPFAALDKGLRERLRLELKELLAEIGLPMLLITHDDDDVLSLAEEVVQMSSGRSMAAAPGLALVACDFALERSAMASAAARLGATASRGATSTDGRRKSGRKHGSATTQPKSTPRAEGLAVDRGRRRKPRRPRAHRAAARGRRSRARSRRPRRRSA